MVTATQVSRLDAKLGALAAAIGPDGRPIAVVVFQGEGREFALARHRELRPDHAGRLVRFEYRNQERDDMREMFALHTPEELKALIDGVEANGRGKTIGEQMLADAHRSMPELRLDGSLAQVRDIRARLFSLPGNNSPGPDLAQVGPRSQAHSPLHPPRLTWVRGAVASRWSW